MRIFIFFLTINLVKSFNIPDPFISIGNLATTKFIATKLNELELEKNVTRKIVHITSAPTFIYTWQFYDSQFWASCVPAVMLLLLITKNKKLSEIISRSGDINELGKGPALYALVLYLVTLGFWKNDPIGMIAMSQLAIGDGFAEVIGKKYGKTKWLNSKKSVEGSMAFILSSSFFTFFSLNIVTFFENSHKYSFQEILLISIICSISEVYSKIDDNLSIPIAALITNYFILFFKYYSFIDPIVNN